MVDEVAEHIVVNPSNIFKVRSRAAAARWELRT
jgi:hypothetical protein